MDCAIVQQGLIIKSSVNELSKLLTPKHIRIIWVPMNSKSHGTNYQRDILKIAGTMIKLKDMSREMGITIRTGLAKPWYPMGEEHNTFIGSAATVSISQRSQWKRSKVGIVRRRQN